VGGWVSLASPEGGGWILLGLVGPGVWRPRGGLVVRGVVWLSPAGEMFWWGRGGGGPAASTGGATFFFWLCPHGGFYLLRHFLSSLSVRASHFYLLFF